MSSSGNALARRCNTPARQAVALGPISSGDRQLMAVVRIEAARDRPHLKSAGGLAGQQEAAVATFRCAYEAPNAKIGDHRYQLSLGRDLAS